MRIPMSGVRRIRLVDCEVMGIKGYDSSCQYGFVRNCAACAKDTA